MGNPSSQQTCKILSREFSLHWPPWSTETFSCQREILFHSIPINKILFGTLITQWCSIQAATNKGQSFLFSLLNIRPNWWKLHGHKEKTDEKVRKTYHWGTGRFFEACGIKFFVFNFESCDFASHSAYILILRLHLRLYFCILFPKEDPKSSAPHN